MGRTIIVENKPGASTTIGTDIVAKAKPDGNTILLTIPLLLQTHHLFKKLPYGPLKDIVPIVDLVKSPLWIAVRVANTTAQETRMKQLCFMPSWQDNPLAKNCGCSCSP